MDEGAVDATEFAVAIGSGRQFAERVRLERQERGWSQAELSRRMRSTGYPLDQAAISKIESPPASERARRIDIDEAIGFARVFGLSVEEMTIPLASPTELAAMRILANGTRYGREHRDIESAYRNAVRLVAVAIELYPSIAAQFTRRFKEAPDSSVFSGERTFLSDVEKFLTQFHLSGRSLAKEAWGITTDFDDAGLRKMLGKFLHEFEWPSGPGGSDG